MKIVVMGSPTGLAPVMRSCMQGLAATKTLTMKGKRPMPDKSNKSPDYPSTEDGLWEALFETDEMMEYVQATDKIHSAIERGDAEVALPAEFLARAISNKVNFDDPYIVAAWNRCCELVGLPEKRIEVPGPSADEMRTGRDVKTMRIGPLKRSKKDDEGDGGSGGAF